jgi:acyl carrier protein
MNATKNKLNDVFCKVFNKPDLLIEHYMSANDIEGWDSFNHLRLIMFIEKEFNLQVPGTEVMKLKTVGALIDLIENHGESVG